MPGQGRVLPDARASRAHPGAGAPQDGPTHRHVCTLPALPPAVRTAREAAEQALAERDVDAHHPTVGPALPILAELVTNGVRHAVPLSP